MVLLLLFTICSCNNPDPGPLDAAPRDTTQRQADSTEKAAIDSANASADSNVDTTSGKFGDGAVH
ncbi:MAG: hypothetical protein ABIX01_06950 [Chitinophagaceae bacterium]